MQGLEHDQRPQHGPDHGHGDQRVDRGGGRDEGQEGQRGDQPLGAEGSKGAELERHVTEQVEGGPADERSRRLPRQGIVHAGESLLHVEGDEHDGRHHRQVEVGVAVAGQPVAALDRLERGELPRRRQGRDVEVDPPQRARRDPEHRGTDHPGIDARLSPDSDRHDGLAQGHDHDEPVALGEVGGDEPPAARVDHEGTGHVEQEGGGPHDQSGVPVEKAAHHEDCDAECGARRQSDDGVAQTGIVTTGEDEQGDVSGPHAAVGRGEDQTELAVGVRHAQRRHQQRSHGGKEDESHRPFVRVDHARQPGVADP